MIISEIKLKNYRGFSGQKVFPLGRQFTVVAGINGRGKTALLDAVALLLSRLLRSLHLTTGDLRTITKSDVFGGQSVDTEVSAKMNCAGTPLDYRVSLTNGRRNVMATRITPVLRQEIVRSYGDTSRSDDQLPIAVYYTTDRAGYRLPKTLPGRLPEGQEIAYSGALFNRMVDYRDFMARYRVWSDQPSSRPLRAFNSALSGFLDGFSDVQVENEPLRLTVKKGQHRLALGQLSDGERAFLAVIGDIVRRLAIANPRLENPLLGFGVVLIDELELHLHPQWQRDVVDRLRETFPNIQFITTTHSPFIIQTLRPNELILLDDLIPGSYSNRGLDEIATRVMGIADPDVSPRYLEMLDTAKAYFTALESAPESSAMQRATLKRRLNELSSQYADNPAYQAFLELETVKALKE